MKASSSKPKRSFRPVVTALALFVGVVSAESVSNESECDPTESERLAKVERRERDVERQRLFAVIRQKLNSPWKLTDKEDEGVFPEVVVAIRSDLICIGQPARELEAAFGKESMSWLDGKGQGLCLISLARLQKFLDDDDRKRIDKMASGPGSNWFLFVYVDKRTGEISDLLLRFGTFNGFNLRGFLTAKPRSMDQHEKVTDEDSRSGNSGPVPRQPSE